ncbi:hypothetical protein [Ereboglobus luteus]|uniref:hypothetical protein n=1 Tax=Ereboglobus luteus TaxID=1796921 RepID=UPI0012602C42|nr:hypothetical protein [Ereboglobus luteus]
MPRKKQIPYRNQSPTGWWIYEEIEQWVSNRQKRLTPNSRCLVWQNTRIIMAKNRHEAFQKAMRLSKKTFPSKTDGGEWRFAGISMLLPIYEKMKDGSEVLWTERGKMSQRQIQRLVKSKQQLSVFDDEYHDER